MSTKERTFILPPYKHTAAALLNNARAELENAAREVENDLDKESVISVLKAQGFLAAFQDFVRASTEDGSE